MNKKNYNDAELKKADIDHHFHPFTAHKSFHEGGGPKIITNGQGCWLEDSYGQQIFDAMSGLWCVNIGYGNERLAEVAKQQIMELAYYNTFFQTATPPVIQLAEKISSLLPDTINSVFFNSSGSEANDSVVRMVRTYWQAKKQPKKHAIISRVRAYHGSTIAGSSLGGMSFMHDHAGGELPNVHHVMQAYQFGMGEKNESAEDFGLRAAQAIEDKILELGSENVAAFIGEPIMGAAGVYIPPENYWPRVEEICKKHDVLLCVDEVICGYGRTGKWFGFQHSGISPDTITMAKGLSSGYVPISAVAVSDRVRDVLYNLDDEFAHGYTYSGHPVACAVALENIKIIEDLKLVEKVAQETGPYLAQKIQTLLDHPLVGEARSFGMLGAFEIVKDKTTNEGFNSSVGAGAVVRDAFIAQNCIMRACGDTMVLAPPLIITCDEIDVMIERSILGLDDAYQKLRNL